jgi:hypothetical protein
MKRQTRATVVNPGPKNTGTFVSVEIPPVPEQIGAFHYSWGLPRKVPDHLPHVSREWRERFFAGYDGARKRTLAELERGIY